MGCQTQISDLSNIKAANAALRGRKHLTPDEVATMITAAQKDRHGLRDALMILLAYRHALRASEIVNLTWDQIDLKNARIHVKRAKKGIDSTHYLEGDEIRALRALNRETGDHRYVFLSQKNGPLNERTFHTLVKRAGEVLDLGWPVHPHMLRHAKGAQLVNADAPLRAIQLYMGHSSINSTIIYTHLEAKRFADFGKNDLR